MNIYAKGHDRHYDLQCMGLLFTPASAVNVVAGYPKKPFADDGKITVYSSLTQKNGVSVCRTAIKMGEKHVSSLSKSKGEDKSAVQMAVKRSFLYAGMKFFEIRPPWGVLTGIRPSKFAYDLSKTYGEKRAFSILTKDYCLSEEKANLALEVARQRDTLPLYTSFRDVSLYVSIPFCPSRCSYCSFISHDVNKSKKLLPLYLDILHSQIAAAGTLSRRQGLTVRSVYIGGGTPTILSMDEITALLDVLQSSFDFSDLQEMTFEAGRPDTLTPEKLLAILRGKAKRISINPQSMNPLVLQNIGRNHTPEDVVNAFKMAKAAKVPLINADIIAGLPGDTPEGFAETLSAVIALKPENITVHTLSIKRSSAIKNNETAIKGENFAKNTGLLKQLSHSRDILEENGYHPYYMYRQKNTAGNLENVGYALSGTECLYNIYMMDELSTVLGMGAGAVTKLVSPEGKITRIFEPKYPYEYIGRQEDIALRMKRMTEFYEQHYSSLGI